MITDNVNSHNNRIAEAWKMSEMTLAAHAARKHVPLGGTFELTPRCNLRCKMCYVRLDRRQMEKLGRELTAAEWIAIAKDAFDAGTLNLLITGGEPLIREDFEEIYTALANMGFIITLNTNATLMTPRLLKLLKRYPPTATNVTLYGASADTYSRISGNPDAFGQTIRGLEMLCEVPTVLEVRSTFIKDNMGELDALRDIAYRYTKHFAINVNVMKGIRGAAPDIENCRLSPAEMFDLSQANKDFYKELGKDEAAEGKNMDTDHYAGARDFGFDLPPEIIYCLAAKSMYWITWDGKMLPCGTFSSPYTLPLEEGFRQAWDRLPALLENISLPQECATCEYADGKCPNCPAILQAESGCFDKISPYICETAKVRAIREINSL